MAKTLVSGKGVEALVTDGTFYMDGTMILTSGAKDVLRDNGVTIVYGPKPETCDNDQFENFVAAFLAKEYGITDEDQVKAMTRLIHMIK